ncbi:MAG: PHP domain-containing protein, partial [Halanaerobiaceae bacterium]
MKIEVDLHMHTLNSGHAYSTITEMAKAAAGQNLKLIAVTDHGPLLPGGPHEYY